MMTSRLNRLAFSSPSTASVPNRGACSMMVCAATTGAVGSISTAAAPATSVNGARFDVITGQPQLCASSTGQP